jgi:hypothetical protein
MCFAFLGTASWFSRCLFVLVTFLVVVGPVLMITGVVVLTMENKRTTAVREFNDDALSYSLIDGRILADTDMQMAGHELTKRFIDIPLSGSTEDVNPAQHYIFSRSGIARPVADQYTVIVNTPNLPPQFVTYAIPNRRNIDRKLRCDAPRCSEDCSSSVYKCGGTRMREYCRNAFGGSYDDASGSCSTGEVCGTCSFTGTLSRACVVMGVTENGIVRPSTQTSCYYPFDEHEYLPSASTATIEVMSERDPFITLERLTKGSGDFGMTKGRQRKIGIALLIAGAAVTVAMSAVMFAFIRRQQVVHERKTLQRRPQSIAEAPPPPQYGEPVKRPQQPFPHYDHPLHESPAYHPQSMRKYESAPFGDFRIHNG